MIPLHDDISVVEGFIYTIQKTIEENGDPDETEHLQAESHCFDFIAAMKWVKHLHSQSPLLSDEAPDQGWKQFLANIEGVMHYVVRWAYAKYPEGLIYAKLFRRRGGGVWDASGGTDPELFGDYEEDNTGNFSMRRDWSWAVKAAMELELVSKVLFKHCEQVTGMMHVDFMATALEEMSL